MHLEVHGVRAFEQARPDPQEDGQADRRAAAVDALEGVRYHIKRPSRSDPESGATESGELPDVT